MWARVKGRTENALRRLPFKAAYMLRPGMIQPMHGIRSKTGWYNAIYAISAPIIPLLQKLLPQYVTTTEVLGRAMLAIARHGFERPIWRAAISMRWATALDDFVFVGHWQDRAFAPPFDAGQWNSASPRLTMGKLVRPMMMPSSSANTGTETCAHGIGDDADGLTSPHPVTNPSHGMQNAAFRGPRPGS